MKITAQEEYGLRCVLQLAREQTADSDGNLEPGAVFVRDIAEREGLSVAYVEKILWTLSHSGIVESVRGPKGGYRLTRPCGEISLGEVMRALGGIPSEEEICSQFTGNQDVCVHHDGCGLKPVWTSITDFVNSVFDRVSISTLLTGSVDVKFVQITSRGGAKEPMQARPAA
jgi:Rrf2 family transcriptional regulator, iron-sulfur cluster assembly transcription factor